MRESQIYYIVGVDFVNPLFLVTKKGEVASPPTIIVSGKQNPMTCSSSFGEKERTPRMDSFEMEAIVKIISFNLYGWKRPKIGCEQSSKMGKNAT